jgi:hypothetical protein
MSDIDKEIAPITRCMRAAAHDYDHARLYDPGHPNTERLRRQIADDKLHPTFSGSRNRIALQLKMTLNLLRKR